MDNAVKKYLYDIQQSVYRIEEFLGNSKVFADYAGNVLLQAAVERHIEIIGEAMNNILKINATIEISDARKIVNTRNRIIHGYDDIDCVEIWNIIINNLPVLKKEVEALLSDN